MSKKKYTELPKVEDFIQNLSEDVQSEYARIVDELEQRGRLERPFGEKVEPKLFAIRVIQAANIRVFYVYGYGDNVFGIHGYVKKTNDIPLHELKLARKIQKKMRAEGLIP